MRINGHCIEIHWIGLSQLETGMRGFTLDFCLFCLLASNWFVSSLTLKQENRVAGGNSGTVSTVSLGLQNIRISGGHGELL